MAKTKTAVELEPTAVEARVARDPASQAERERQSRLDDHFLSPAPAAAAQPEPAGGPIWRVSIPNCLLGERLVQAKTEQDAVERYKAVCGISVHEQPARAVRTDMDPAALPEGVELFGA